MNKIHVKRMTCARIPTDAGEFRLCFYQNNLDDKEHLALLIGDVETHPNPLVRIHSECFTGDVLGSLRCDCGPQLQRAMGLVAEEGAGIIVYLRQEGRGIGLLDKLRAYNLQDEGYDTVEANLMLGHRADGRDYRIAAHILADLGVAQLRLMTNNPTKIEGLEALGVRVSARVSLQTAVTSENAAYLATKVERMRHMLNVGAAQNGEDNGRYPTHLNGTTNIFQTKNKVVHPTRPTITLSYAQSLDGSITRQRGQPMAISGAQSMLLTHQLRAEHDAILVGIGTLLADDPSLTVRHVSGNDPQPIILDSHLRFPLSARLLQNKQRKPWIVTTEKADRQKQTRLESAGAHVLRIPAGVNGCVNLHAMLKELAALNIQTLMVEGGAEVITSFLASRLVDQLALTIAPLFIGGLHAVTDLSALNGHGLPHLNNCRYQQFGKDMVLFGDVVWKDGQERVAENYLEDAVPA